MEEEAGGKSSVLTKRSRAAAIHNQSERVHIQFIIQHLFLLKCYSYTTVSLMHTPFINKRALLVDFITEEER